MRLGIPIVDHLTGYVAMSGILMALYARERTGIGPARRGRAFRRGLEPARAACRQLVLFGPRAAAARQRAPQHLSRTTNSAPATARSFSPSPTTASSASSASTSAGWTLAADARFATNASRLENRDGVAGRAREGVCRVRSRAILPGPDARGRSRRARSIPFRRRWRRRMPRIAGCWSRTATIAASAHR